MTQPRLAVIASNQTAWNREAAGIVNRLIVQFNTLGGAAVKKDGAVIYAGDTAGVSYDQTQMQALMDAVKALSDRLE